MRTLGLVFVCLIGAVFFLTAEENKNNFLQRIDAQGAFFGMDFSARYWVVHSKPGQDNKGFRILLFRRDSSKSLLLVFAQPSEKLSGLLMDGKRPWFYDEKDRIYINLSVHENVQKTTVRYFDFLPSSFATDYQIVNQSPQKLGKFDTTVLTLQSVNSELEFPRVKLWVSSDDLVRKKEDYSSSNELVRTTAIRDYEKINNHVFPKWIVMQDNLSGQEVNGKRVYEMTQITLEASNSGENLEEVFTKGYLENFWKLR